MLLVSQKHIYVFIVILGVFFLARGCTLTSPTDKASQGSFKGTTTPIIFTPIANEPDPLDGTQWQLMSITHQGRTITIDKHTHPLIQFNKGGLGFYVGCNDINGYYELDEHNIIITLSEQTAMDCTDRLGVKIMEIEDSFYKAMQTFESYSVQDEKLQIYYADGELLFRRSAN